MSAPQKIITSQQSSQPVTVKIDNPVLTQSTEFNWLTFLSIVLLAITAWLNYLSFRENQKNLKDSKKLQEEERKLKKLNLSSELQKQYYYITIDFKNKVQNGEITLEQYYRRYWIDREYEFTLYRNKFIDTNIYIQWMLSEKADYESPETLQGWTYEQGYEQTKKFFQSRTSSKSISGEFFQFMDMVFKPENDSVDEAIKNLQKNNQ